MSCIWHGNDEDRGVLSKDREKGIMGTYYYRCDLLFEREVNLFLQRTQKIFKVLR